MGRGQLPEKIAVMLIRLVVIRIDGTGYSKYNKKELLKCLKYVQWLCEDQQFIDFQN